MGYTAQLLKPYPGAELIPEEPVFDPGKTPGDVYRRLLGCFEKLREIAAASGEEMLELEVDVALIDVAEPSDVYDVASLIVAELAHLHAQLPGGEPPREIYYVGRKFPADVYQRVGILEQQLVQLDKYVGSQQQVSGE